MAAEQKDGDQPLSSHHDGKMESGPDTTCNNVTEPPAGQTDDVDQRRVLSPDNKDGDAPSMPGKLDNVEPLNKLVDSVKKEPRAKMCISPAKATGVLLDKHSDINRKTEPPPTQRVATARKSIVKNNDRARNTPQISGKIADYLTKNSEKKEDCDNARSTSSTTPVVNDDGAEMRSEAGDNISPVTLNGSHSGEKTKEQGSISRPLPTARKSGGGPRYKQINSVIKTVNLAPISNIKVTLPDSEDALKLVVMNTVPESEDASDSKAGKSTDAKEPPTASSLLTAAEKQKLKHKRRKRLGTYDLPSGKNKKKAGKRKGGSPQDASPNSEKSPIKKNHFMRKGMKSPLKSVTTILELLKKNSKTSNHAQGVKKVLNKKKLLRKRHMEQGDGNDTTVADLMSLGRTKSDGNGNTIADLVRLGRAKQLINLKGDKSSEMLLNNGVMGDEDLAARLVRKRKTDGDDGVISPSATLGESDSSMGAGKKRKCDGTIPSPMVTVLPTHMTPTTTGLRSLLTKSNLPLNVSLPIKEEPNSILDFSSKVYTQLTLTGTKTNAANVTSVALPKNVNIDRHMDNSVVRCLIPEASASSLPLNSFSGSKSSLNGGDPDTNENLELHSIYSNNSGSSKQLHLPNGVRYPVTPPKTPENQLSASSPERDIIPLCCCKINGASFNKLGTGVTYCQALDSVDGKVMGCCNKVSVSQLIRPAVKIPFMAVCEVHRRRLKHHQCCPGCGHFCTQGKFYQCRKESSSSLHHFHKQCQVFKDGRYYCPHCGEESAQYEITLVFNEQKKIATSDNDGTERTSALIKSRAKMSIQYPSLTASTDPGLSHTIEKTGKMLSTADVPCGPDKQSLEKLLESITQERPKKYRTLPKQMYNPTAEGDIDKVMYMLVDGHDPNEAHEDEENQTALHAAAISGHLSILHMLLQAGANVHCVDSKLRTPLMYAAENGHAAAVRYLVTAGALLDVRGSDGLTCIHLAAMSGYIDVLRFLINTKKIDVNVQDDGGWTSIIWAAEHRHLEAVRYLLSQGGDPNTKDNEENTSLHWAAFSGSYDIAEVFLDAGCALEAVNEHGDRPLHIAARQDHYECVVLFLARGADVDARNNTGDTPVGCCLLESSQVSLALKINKQLKGLAAKRLGKGEKLLHRDVSLGRETNPVPCVNEVDDDTYPQDYQYVIENVETSHMNINRVITSLQTCHCKDDCSSMYCVCSRSSVKCWYDKEGKLVPEFNNLEPPLIFECNRGCQCWSNCQNRVIQNGILCRLQLLKTVGRGWGVKTLLDIPRGTFICEYIGELISDSEADRREDDSYLFDLDNKEGETYCIDARKYGNVSRFINHLCEPNIIPVKVFVKHQDLRFPRICFFASRDIKAFEELGFDYGEKFWVIKWKQFTCTCGSTKCKYSSETIHATLADYKRRHDEEDVDTSETTNAV